MTADIRYPIGQVALESSLTPERRNELIERVAATPAQLRAAVANLSTAQLDTPYRPEGWTVRQLVHHMADSHMNSYVRFRLALTEQEPTIKPYDEKLWAELDDARSAPVELSLPLLDSLHARWTLLLRSLGPSNFARTFRHPELGVMTLDANLCLYAWHGPHHIAQIRSLRDRMNWS